MDGDYLALCGISTKGNPEQQELARLILDNKTKIIFCFGNAGTGKTFVSLAASIQMLSIDKKYGKRGKIFYIREPIEVGRSLGFLPGDVDDKYGVYLGGLTDNLTKIEDIGGIINAHNEMTRIECIPPQYIRGRSIDNAVLIVDEAQNLSALSLKTILTRTGDYTKVILLGSVNQIDVRAMTKDNNDFLKVYDRLKDFDFVDSVTLIKSERSAICAIIDDALSDLA
jgi:PhoH-like ATPase